MNNAVLPLTGTSIMTFNPQSLWRKAFPVATNNSDAPAAAELGSVRTSSRLARNQPVYLLEPDEVRKCMEKIIPQQILCLVLLNKTP